jgi:hypothetical protein
MEMQMPILSDSQKPSKKTRDTSESLKTAGGGAKALAARAPESAAEVRQRIAVAAYCRAERRNFEAGHELEDWLEAEAEVLAQRAGMKGFPA